MPSNPGDILLNKYRIEKLLGSGAFGEVYLVTHLGLKVKRAVKVLRRDAPGVGSSDFRRSCLAGALSRSQDSGGDRLFRYSCQGRILCKIGMLL